MKFFSLTFVTIGGVLAVLGSTQIPTGHKTGGLLLTGFGVGWASAIVAAWLAAGGLLHREEPQGAPPRDPHFASGGFVPTTGRGGADA